MKINYKSKSKKNNKENNMSCEKSSNNLELDSNIIEYLVEQRKKKIEKKIQDRKDLSNLNRLVLERNFIKKEMPRINNVKTLNLIRKRIYKINMMIKKLIFKNDQKADESIIDIKDNYAVNSKVKFGKSKINIDQLDNSLNLSKSSIKNIKSNDISNDDIIIDKAFDEVIYKLNEKFEKDYQVGKIIHEIEVQKQEEEIENLNNKKFKEAIKPIAYLERYHFCREKKGVGKTLFQSSSNLKNSCLFEKSFRPTGFKCSEQNKLLCDNALKNHFNKQKNKKSKKKSIEFSSKNNSNNFNNNNIVTDYSFNKRSTKKSILTKNQNKKEKNISKTESEYSNFINSSGRKKSFFFKTKLNDEIINSGTSSILIPLIDTDNKMLGNPNNVLFNGSSDKLANYSNCSLINKSDQSLCTINDPPLFKDELERKDFINNLQGIKTNYTLTKYDISKSNDQNSRSLMKMISVKASFLAKKKLKEFNSKLSKQKKNNLNSNDNLEHILKTENLKTISNTQNLSTKITDANECKGSTKILNSEIKLSSNNKIKNGSAKSFKSKVLDKNHDIVVKKSNLNINIKESINNNTSSSRQSTNLQKDLKLKSNSVIKNGLNETIENKFLNSIDDMGKIRNKIMDINTDKEKIDICLNDLKNMKDNKNKVKNNKKREKELTKLAKQMYNEGNYVIPKFKQNNMKIMFDVMETTNLKSSKVLIEKIIKGQEYYDRLMNTDIYHTVSDYELKLDTLKSNKVAKNIGFKAMMMKAEKNLLFDKEILNEIKEAEKLNHWSFTEYFEWLINKQRILHQTGYDKRIKKNK
jgi:hypothetical protein